MQHPEENLKQFIHTIAAYYDRIGGEASEMEKVNRVLRQRDPQLQDLVEGKQFTHFTELAKAANSLMELAWRELQYKAPPPPTDQVTRDLAFQSAVNVTGLPRMHPRVSIDVSVTQFLSQPVASYFPLHPVVTQPSQQQDQLHGLTARAIRPPLAVMSQDTNSATPGNLPAIAKEVWVT